jgi:hypothetical protein
MKRHLTSVLLASALVLCFSLPALAQEDIDPDNHSTIGGQLVPTGEHNKYEYSYKKHLISTNPLAWFLGTFGIGYSYAFSQYISVRGDAAFLHVRDTDLYGFELDVSAPIFFKKMNDGFYLEPGLFALYVDVGDAGNAQGGGVQLILGWSWIWDSGFNINLGAGLGNAWLSASSSGDTDTYDGLIPRGRLQFGYAF